MSYLARLKALLAEESLPEQLTELTKAPSVSFVSEQGNPVPEGEGASVSSVSDRERRVSCNDDADSGVIEERAVCVPAAKTTLPDELTELTNAASVGSVSDQGACPSDLDLVRAPTSRIDRGRDLERENVPASRTDETDKRASVISASERENHVFAPALAARIDALRSLACPTDFSPERFERMRQGAVRFAAEVAAEALRLGWTHDQLFAFAEPFARLDLQGAAWFIGDAIITGITADAITIRSATGATKRIYRGDGKIRLETGWPLREKPFRQPCPQTSRRA